MTAPGQRPPAFPMPLATSITPADTADTAVLDPRPGEQISVGAVELSQHDDVVYRTVDGRALALDLVRPATHERLPLLVYLPGGGFVMADKANAAVPRTFVAESGFVVASVEYRTVGDKATYVDAVSDVHAAIAYLRSHADDYGIDPRAVGVWGESAGGYVAAMAGVTNELDQLNAGTGAEGRVDAVIDSFGASDLAAIGADFDAEFQAFFRDNPTPMSAYLGAPEQSLSEIPDDIVAADPATYAAATTPPFLLLHGTQDILISPSQTQHLHQALLAKGVDSTRYLLDGASHGDMAFLGQVDSGLPWSSTTTMGIITEFLHRHLDR